MEVHRARRCRRYGSASAAALWLAVGCAVLAPRATEAQSGRDYLRFLRYEPYRWTKFVPVAGQPEPVPVEWVSTPEGAFAHSLKIPNPVPKDSGYRPWMSSKQYHEHLCKHEAGRFIFRTVRYVKSIYFARPPGSATDFALQSPYRLEAPDIERNFQLQLAAIEHRARHFVSPAWTKYTHIEEPTHNNPFGKFTRAWADENLRREIVTRTVFELESRFAVTWRGIRRERDRESLVAGSEWIVYEIGSGDVLGVWRNFVRSPRAPNMPESVWWLNASSCPEAKHETVNPARFYEFVSEVLAPAARDGMR